MPDRKTVMISSTTRDLPKHWQVVLEGDDPVVIVGSYNRARAGVYDNDKTKPVSSMTWFRSDDSGRLSVCSRISGRI